MTPAQSRLIAAVRAALGPKAVIDDPADIEPWLHDWRGRYHGRTPAILAPDGTAAVATIVRLARDHAVPLVPQGGNTSMVGGATPPADGSAVILSLRRLDRIRGLDPYANLAIAEAGVILSHLHDAALARGRRFPLTLGSRGSATIGGLVSTNAGGTQVLRFGTMRALVAGVEAVLPDGQIHDGLSALKKDNRGYDLDHLLVGAEGTLGIVTAATLRLVPAIVARGVAWVGVASPHDALALLRRLEAATDSIESFELLPAESLSAVLRHLPAARAPLVGSSPWHVLIEAVATDPAAEPPPARLERLLATALDDGLATDAVVAASEAQAEAFPGHHASGFGHLGDGNVHFHVRAPAGADPERWYAEQAPRVTAFVHDLVTAAGGSISAEHGIGQMKLDELERLASPARLAALRAIKAGLDPLGLFNPGKLVTLAPHAPRP